ncbi:MAG: hypothetical protein ACHQT8_04865, partial [Chlamydiales bacterium]
MFRRIILSVLLSTYAVSASQSQPNVNEDSDHFFQAIQQKALYLTTGAAFGAVSFLTRAASGIVQLFGEKTAREECLYLSNLCNSVSRHLTEEFFHPSRASVELEKEIVPISHLSWHLNRRQLAQIPAICKEEKELLLFLEKHWLAKSTGFFSSMIRWVLPCFGIAIQVHPETTHSYARMTGSTLSLTYKNRVETWIRSLPHPAHFPLILTRPSSVREYLPTSIVFSSDDALETIAHRLKAEMQAGEKQVLLDLTPLFSQKIRTRNEWQKIWNGFRAPFTQVCQALSLDPEKILCFQTLRQEATGGIRLLPLTSSTQALEEQHQFLQKWVSTFGLTANRIELDRAAVSADHLSFPALENVTANALHLEQEKFYAQILTFEKSWKSEHPQKNLMVKGSLKLLKSLLATISTEKWNSILHSITKSHATELAFTQIAQKLSSLREETSFSEIASHLEEIYASLAALLEIFEPYTLSDFPKIYSGLITSPSDLKPLIYSTLHTSGMTSLAGIFKTAKNVLGRAPNILFGENAYFECISAAQQIGPTCSIEDAREEEWEKVDLILGQFNPALKRIETNPIDYKVEKIADALRRALNARQEKSIILALDCTLDYIDSPKASHLLNEFQEEIKLGNLCIIAYRSGLKFDLFGMDNYCGAPLFMIRNNDSKWKAFDALLTDPVLQADSLSTNWFCLAYQNVSAELEGYRKQIFDNTRALLTKIPRELFGNSPYRIVPVEANADAAFIDIKISGPLHQIRGSTLVGGTFVLKCLENG